MTYLFTLAFEGRQVGAIGIFYRCVVDVEAKTYDEAVARLSETHERTNGPPRIIRCNPPMSPEVR